MKKMMWVVLALLLAAPLYGQGLTITLRESGPMGQSAPALKTDGPRARLDIPSMASQILYDASSRTLQLLVPLLRTYQEFTPASVQVAAAARGQGAAPLAPISYRRTGTGKVRDWSCNTYDGFRGAEKVAEICAAEGAAVGLAAADFTVVQQAVDMVKAIAPPAIIERVPVYGATATHGFSGFVVRRVNLKNGQPEITTELVEIKREAIPATTFALPAGLTRAP